MSLAEKLHAAFVAYWPDAPTFADWPKQGASWYTLASMRDELLEAPEQRAPFDQDLHTPIPPRKKPGTEIVVTETLPTSLHIRAQVAGDLCLPECAVGGNAFGFARQARIHGVTVDMLEVRVDPVDQELGDILIRDSTGPDAAQILLVAAMKARLEAPESVYDNVDIWESMSRAMFVEDKGNHAMVACRTPGLGTIKIGPYRPRHIRIWEDTSEDTNEWAGRLAALADLSGNPLSVIEQARTEDVTLMWSAFMALKKNANATAKSKYWEILSARSSTTDQVTSKDGPTPS